MDPNIDKDFYELLLDFALRANPERFFPFPDEYRTEEKKEEIIPGLFSYTKKEYEKLRGDLLKVPKTKAEAKDFDSPIMSYLFNVNLRMCYYGTSFLNIEEYEYRYDRIDEIYWNKKYKERWYLFHGSNVSNWHSLLRNGIRNMSNTKFMSVGAAYGSGVYMSDLLQVSLSYGTSQDRKSYVAVVELREDYDKYKKSYGIYVLPDNIGFVPRYLLKMDPGQASTGKELLTFYSELRTKAMPQKTIAKRFERDYKVFEEKYKDEYKITHEAKEQIICIDMYGLKLKILYDNYPFETPIAIIEDEPPAKLNIKKLEDNNIWVIENEWKPTDTLCSFIETCKQTFLSTLDG